MSKEKILIAIVCYLLLINLVSFIFMGLDKRKAQKGAWRIPEKSLFMPVILGGGIGGILGMKFFRHKTKHWYFVIGFPFICVIEYALIGYLIYSNFLA